MRVSIRKLVVLSALAAAAVPAQPTDVVLRDAAARIEFGWYSDDERLILAAAEALSGSDSDPRRSYLRGYAAYRVAQLRLAGGRGTGTALDDCDEQSEHAGQAANGAAIESEALIVRAACAALAAREEPLRAVLHQRRLRQVLADAERLDPENPRLQLVRLQYLDAADAAAARPNADAWLANFRARAGQGGFVDWGEVEAMVLIGTQRFESGDVRGARDLAQQALLLAPAYEPAVVLERRILNRHAAD